MSVEKTRSSFPVSEPDIAEGRMLRIYVAGPYEAATAAGKESNVRRAVRVGARLAAIGHAPHVPHLSHWLHLVIPLPYEHWMRADAEWLDLCHGLFYMRPSPGADRERARAEERGIPVWTRVSQVPRGKPSLPPRREPRKADGSLIPGLREVREARGLTQGRMAEDLGVDVSTVRYWETGRAAPPLARLPEIAGRLGIPVADLLPAGFTRPV